MKRNQSRETLQYGAHVDKNRVRTVLCGAAAASVIARGPSIGVQKLGIEFTTIGHAVTRISTVEALWLPRLIRGSSSGLW